MTENRKTLLVSRNHTGLGDWLFLLHVLKAVNEEHPEIDIDLSLHTKHAPRSRIIEQAALSFGIKYRNVFPYGERIPPEGLAYPLVPYDYVCDHLVYDKTGTYLDSMFQQFYGHTRFNVVGGLSPVFMGTTYNIPTKSPSVLMVSGAKTTRKDWAPGHFERLSLMFMQNGIEVIQIGAAGDELLPANDWRIDVPLKEVVSAMYATQCLITVPNGLMVLAGMERIRQVTIYNANENPNRYKTKRQTQMMNPTVEEVYDQVVEDIGGS